MNFLLHRYFAIVELGSAVAGVGAMLPDLWRLADRRVRARAPSVRDALDAGIAHHLAIDRWFHDSAIFYDGERKLVHAFREGSSAPKLGLFAHAAFEMCLDGALLARADLEGHAAALRLDLASVGVERARAAGQEHGAARLDPRDERVFADHLERIWLALGDAGFLAGYMSGAGLCARLERIRVRFGLPRFDDHDRHGVTGALARALDEAGAALDALEVARAS